MLTGTKKGGAQGQQNGSAAAHEGGKMPKQEQGEAPKQDVVYEAYDPLVMRQAAGAETLRFETFDAALDEFYSKVPAHLYPCVLLAARSRPQRATALAIHSSSSSGTVLAVGRTGFKKVKHSFDHVSAGG